MAALETPVLTVMIGEGGSGGALAMAVANEVWMMENATYSILSPEGFASHPLEGQQAGSRGGGGHEDDLPGPEGTGHCGRGDPGAGRPVPGKHASGALRPEGEDRRIFAEIQHHVRPAAGRTAVSEIQKDVGNPFPPERTGGDGGEKRKAGERD